MPAVSSTEESTRPSWWRAGDDDRMLPVIDRYFLGFVVMQIVLLAIVPFGPLGVAVAAAFTIVRGSRWRSMTLWMLGVSFAVMITAPFVLNALGLSAILEVGPAVEVESGR